MVCVSDLLVDFLQCHFALIFLQKLQSRHEESLIGRKSAEKGSLVEESSDTDVQYCEKTSSMKCTQTIRGDPTLLVTSGDCEDLNLRGEIETIVNTAPHAANDLPFCPSVNNLLYSGLQDILTKYNV